MVEKITFSHFKFCESATNIDTITNNTKLNTKIPVWVYYTMISTENGLSRKAYHLRGLK